MAGYRQFHTQFWKDEWVIDLDQQEKFLFIYLFTNELSSISGIYKLPTRVITNETGLSKPCVENTMLKFEQAQKVLYRDGVVWIVNMGKYHGNASPKTRAKVDSDVERIPDCEVKRAYLYYEATGKYPIDTVSIQYGYSSLKDKDKDKTKGASADAPGVEFPPTLDSDEFKSKWMEWTTFRSEIKHKVTPATQKKQLAMLAKFGQDVAMAMIDKSITNGWQGLFPLKESEIRSRANTGSAWQTTKQSRIIDMMNSSNASMEQAGI